VRFNQPGQQGCAAQINYLAGPRRVSLHLSRGANFLDLAVSSARLLAKAHPSPGVEQPASFY